MSYTFKDKTAIVTGAGRGIGLALAKRLLENGCNVVIADLALTDEAEEVIEKNIKSPKAIFQETDATDWSQLQAAFDTSIKTFGGLDIVCPGAGLFEPVSTPTRFTSLPVHTIGRPDRRAHIAWRETYDTDAVDLLQGSHTTREAGDGGFGGAVERYGYGGHLRCDAGYQEHGSRRLVRGEADEVVDR
jgi:NAD(P)-dependent dehydrogenase (short-subunit alcohol dehydrogenase family)